jgi:hypothetical protein
MRKLQELLAKYKLSSQLNVWEVIDIVWNISIAIIGLWIAYKVLKLFI